MTFLLCLQHQQLWWQFSSVVSLREQIVFSPRNLRANRNSVRLETNRNAPQTISPRPVPGAGPESAWVYSDWTFVPDYWGKLTLVHFKQTKFVQSECLVFVVPGKYLVLPSGSLQIISVTAQDRGVYKCGAINPVTKETVQSHGIKLSVKCKCGAFWCELLLLLL